MSLVGYIVFPKTNHEFVMHHALIFEFYMNPLIFRQATCTLMRTLSLLLLKSVEEELGSINQFSVSPKTPAISLNRRSE